jgi:hypothetical protein
MAFWSPTWGGLWWGRVAEREFEKEVVAITEWRVGTSRNYMTTTTGRRGGSRRRNPMSAIRFENVLNDSSEDNEETRLAHERNPIGTVQLGNMFSDDVDHEANLLGRPKSWSELHDGEQSDEDEDMERGRPRERRARRQRYSDMNSTDTVPSLINSHVSLGADVGSPGPENSVLLRLLLVC